MVTSRQLFVLGFVATTSVAPGCSCGKRGGAAEHPSDPTPTVSSSASGVAAADAGRGARRPVVLAFRAKPTGPLQVLAATGEGGAVDALLATSARAATPLYGRYEPDGTLVLGAASKGKGVRDGGAATALSVKPEARDGGAREVRIGQRSTFAEPPAEISELSFVGRIGSARVFGSLASVADEKRPGKLEGKYTYSGHAGSLALEGAVSPSGDVTLTERDGGGHVTGLFTGAAFDGAIVAGAWSSPDGARLRPFVFFREVAELAFDVGDGARIRVHQGKAIVDEIDPRTHRPRYEKHTYTFEAEAPWAAKNASALAALATRMRDASLYDTGCPAGDEAPCEYAQSATFRFAPLAAGFVEADGDGWSTTGDGRHNHIYDCVVLDTMRGEIVDLTAEFSHLDGPRREQIVRDALAASDSMDKDEQARTIPWLLDPGARVCIYERALTFSSAGHWASGNYGGLTSVSVDSKTAGQIFTSTRVKALFKALSDAP